MPRRKRLRKIVSPPDFKGFKPYGNSTSNNVAIDLLYEEYEAIKLSDYDFLSHHEACVKMGISRPTFARIYESARRKIAKALVEIREIKSVYGNAKLDKDWFFCSGCKARFSKPENENRNICPLCKSSNIESLKQQ